MVEIQDSFTALLLLVNPCILHQNNGTTHPSYINYQRRFSVGYVQPIIQQYKSPL